MKQLYAKYKKHAGIAVMACAMLTFGAVNSFAVGTDLLTGVTWSATADDIIATIMPVVSAALPILALFVAIVAAKKTLKMFAR
jgi:hypothetical protein